MKIKARFDFRKLVAIFYIACFVFYLIIGLTPAGATHYEIFTDIEIPAIGLKSEVTALTLKNNQLKTPDKIVGSYSRADNKTLLIGHSSTVFSNLDNTRTGDVIIYNGAKYLIKNITIEKKEDINMTELLSGAKNDTLVVMTCTGTYLENNDATHRLILTAEAIPSSNE